MLTPLTYLSLLALGLAGGFFAGQQLPEPSTANPPNRQPVFHDFRVNSTDSYIALFDHEHPAITDLASRFATLEEAYHYVQDQIDFVPFAPSGPVHETLNHGIGSCLGKATLLGSIYRAMGHPSDQLRIIMGLVMTPQGPAEHVWLDLEHEGRCLQQDPSGMLGRFTFDSFPADHYSNRFVIKESFCFNDRHFAVVSQLNRMRSKPR